MAYNYTNPEVVLSNNFGNIVLILSAWDKNRNIPTHLRDAVKLALAQYEEEYGKKHKYFPISAENPPFIPQIDLIENQEHFNDSRYEFVTFRQKLHLLLSASRFVIIEDSYPSGAILEIGYARNCGTVTIILRKKGENRIMRSTSMTLDFVIHSPDFEVFYYPQEISLDSDKLSREQYKKLIQTIKNGIYWAEQRIKERHQALIGIYRDMVKVDVTILNSNGLIQNTTWVKHGLSINNILEKIGIEKFLSKNYKRYIFINDGVYESADNEWKLLPENEWNTKMIMGSRLKIILNEESNHRGE